MMSMHLRRLHDVAVLAHTDSFFHSPFFESFCDWLVVSTRFYNCENAFVFLELISRNTKAFSQL